MALLAQVSTQRLIVDNISANTLKLSSITVSTIYSGYFIGDGSLLSNVGISSSNLQSTLDGLGTAGYVSTLSMNSSINAAISSLSTAYGTIGGGGLATIPSMLSTFVIYTSSLEASTIQSITLSTLAIVTSSITANFLGVSTALISTMSTNNINFAGGFGYLTLPDIYPNTVYTSTVTTSNLLVGVNSVVSPIQFFGYGGYSNSVIAELSTGATTQELLMFRGSNATDRIRFQTTGSLVFEPGVSARLWPTVPSNVTPAMVINTSSNVGIQTASPGAALDVAGIGRFQVASTLTMNLSTLNGGNPLVNAITTNSMVALTYNSNAFSYDGNQWITGSGPGNQAHGLAFNGSLWVSGTEGGIYSSGDGINWAATSFTSSATSGVAWNGTLWVVGGWYGGMWFSYDGYNWTACPQAPTQAVQDIAWGKDKFIAACAGAVYYSYDGLYWYNLGNILAGGDQTYCVAFNGRQWLIGGRYASTNNIAYSYDGLNWIGSGGTGYNISDFAWNGRIWVAATQTNQTLLTSPDGITWTARTNTNYTDLGGGYVTWNGSFFYAASGNSFIYLSRSTDGITWRSLGTISGQQMRKIRSRYVLPVNGAQQPAGIYAQNIFMGLSTNQTVMRFPGGDGLYRNTAIGEISSFNKRYAQDLVLFKGSTQQDSIRLQTTGEIRFEAGVPTRSFSSISSIAPIQTPTFLISTNSNVGIGTALPAATLDVVGTGRFQNLSTLALNISSINGQVYSAGGGGGAISYLSSYTVSTGSVFTSSVETSSLLNTGGLSTYSLTVYGASTMTVQGYAFFQNILSSYSLVTGNVGLIDSVTQEPVYLQATNGNLLFNGDILTTQTILNSTIEGFGAFGYVSSLSLISTTEGLTVERNAAIQSTVDGLGTAGYVSTLSMNSSITAAISSLSTAYGTIGGGGLATIPSLLSTSAIFTSSILASTIQSIYVSSLLVVTSSLTTGFLGASTALISSLSTNNINLAAGFGYLTLPDIYPNTVYTSTVTTSNLLVGINSVVSPIQFFGYGGYSNSVIAELSTGATTQELLMFRGSNATDRMRFQTTGSLVFEPGVSARLWPTVPSNVTPAMVINTSSNVGIQTASPGATLDVVGTGRFLTISTQAIFTSSIVAPYVFAAQYFTF